MFAEGISLVVLHDHSGLLRLSALGLMQYFDGKPKYSTEQGKTQMRK